MRALLLAKADVHCTDSAGCSAVHYAARAGQVACLAELQDAEVSMSSIDNEGHTPAQLAQMRLDEQSQSSSRHEASRKALHVKELPVITLPVTNHAQHVRD